MARAFSYQRFSHPSQVKSSSLKRQLEASERFAAEHNLDLDTSSFQDLGISGFTGANYEGALGEFIHLVKSGKIPINDGVWLLVENFDRLSRMKPTAAFAKFIEILELGVTIATLTDNRIYTRESINQDSTQLLSSIIIMLRANEESELKSQRLKHAWMKKREKAATDRTVKITSQTPYWIRLNKETGEFQLVEDRVKLVQRIFNLMDNGLGIHKITRILNEENIPTFGRAQNWYKSYLQRLAFNEAVIGNFQPMSKASGTRKPNGPVIPNYYPPIIEEDVYWRVKEARLERKIVNKGRKGKKYTNLFTGIVKCQNCGSTFGYNNKWNSDRGRYLKCSGKEKALCENNSKLIYSKFEAIIIEYIEAIDIASLFPRSQDKSQELKAALEGKTSKLSDVSQKRGIILENLDDEQALSVAGNMLAQIQILKSEIEQLNQDLKIAGAQTHTIEDHIKDVGALNALMANTDEEEELYQLRARLAHEIRKVIIRIDVDETGVMFVVIHEEESYHSGYIIFQLSTQYDPALHDDKYLMFRTTHYGFVEGRPDEEETKLYMPVKFI